jgi:hypothetical protein
MKTVSALAFAGKKVRIEKTMANVQGLSRDLYKRQQPHHARGCDVYRRNFLAYLPLLG